MRKMPIPFRGAFVLLILALGCLEAQAPVTGQLTVDGKPVRFTQVYAYSTEGFFDKAKDDTVVLLTDRPVSDAEMRDTFALRRLVADGKLSYVQDTINAAGQIVNFTVGHRAFKAIPSGGSTEHVFEGKSEGRTISGKVSTHGVQEFFGTTYEYTATFKTPILPKK